MAGKGLFYPCFSPLTPVTSEARPKVVMANVFLCGDSWNHHFFAPHLCLSPPLLMIYPF